MILPSVKARITVKKLSSVTEKDAMKAQNFINPGHIMAEKLSFLKGAVYLDSRVRQIFTFPIDFFQNFACIFFDFRTAKRPEKIEVACRISFRLYCSKSRSRTIWILMFSWGF